MYRKISRPNGNTNTKTFHPMNTKTNRKYFNPMNMNATKCSFWPEPCQRTKFRLSIHQTTHFQYVKFLLTVICHSYNEIVINKQQHPALRHYYSKYQFIITSLSYVTYFIIKRREINKLAMKDKRR